MKIKKILSLFFLILFATKLIAQQPKVTNAFYFSSGIAADSRNNLFVTGKNKKVIKITPDGKAHDFAGKLNGTGSVKDGTATGASFSEINGIAIDEKDNLYITDYTTIRKVTPDAVATTLYGNNNVAKIQDGNKAEATFRKPKCIAVDKNGMLYVSDEIFDSLEKRSFEIIRKIDSEGNVTTIKNAGGSTFRSPWIYGLTCDNSNNLYVSAMAWSSCIYKISPDEVITTVAGILLTDITQKRPAFKEGTINIARLVGPYGIALNKKGEIFFADNWLHRIIKISGNQVTTFAGGLISGSKDGKGKQALFYNPCAIAFDKAGNLFIVDAGSTVNSYIRKLSPDGSVTTFCKHYFNADIKQYVEKE